MQSISEDIDLAPIHLRGIAFLLDASILIVLVLTVSSFGVASGAGVGSTLPVMIALSAAYNIGFVSITGATPGKTAVGLCIVDREGLKPAADTAVLRFLLYFVFGALFPFGTIANVASMFADAQRRTFTDRIAGTLVLQEPPEG